VIGLDHRIERYITGHRVHALDWIFVWLSRIGAGGTVWVLLALVLAVVWRRPAIFVGTGSAALVSALTVTPLQDAIGRHRPPLLIHTLRPLVRVPHHGSFPSGHTTTAFACAFVLAGLVRRRRDRVGLYVLAAAIGFSRLYVGVHFPLDVLAGAVLGTLYGFVVLQVVRRLQHAGDDDAERGDERDPEADPAAGRLDPQRHPEHAVEHEDGREHAEPDQHEALRQAGRQHDAEAP
jgi:undecaprenyl-diphosphatase